MLSLLLLILTLLMSGVVTRIGAIALEITGMPEEQAAFQATSAYSRAGFTTRESELVLAHPKRRAIIKNLIRLGSAGIITTMATSVGTILSSNSILNSVMDDKYFSWLPEINQTQLLLILIILCFYGIHELLSKPAVSRLIKEIITQVLIEGHVVDPVQYEEVLALPSGYGIVQVDVCEKNPVYGKSLKDVSLEEHHIKILAIERISESIMDPPSEEQILLGDRLILYGPIKAIQESCCVILTRETQKKNKAILADEPLALLNSAPNFILPDQNGNLFDLGQYRGKRHVLLVFYPKDKSFTCTSQLRKFQDHLAALHAMDIEVVALNQESVVSHRAFAELLNITFPILSDSDKRTCKAYKALMLGGLLVNRTVYLIDKEGKIRFAKRGNPGVTEIVSALKKQFVFQKPTCALPSI